MRVWSRDARHHQDALERTVCLRAVQLFAGIALEQTGTARASACSGAKRPNFARLVWSEEAIWTRLPRWD